MKRLLLALLLIVGASFPAYAQQMLCYTTNGQNCIKVGTPASSGIGPLPVDIISQNSLAPGAATAANQVTEIASLATINTTISNQAISAGTAGAPSSQVLTVQGTVGMSPMAVGFSQQVSSTPTITNAQYSQNNCIGGFNAITVTPNDGQSGYVTNFRIASITGNISTNVIVYLFDSNPSSSTCTDRSTFTLNANDVPKLIASPQVVTPTATTGISTSFAGIEFIPPRPFVAGGSSGSGVKTIYYGIQNGITAFTPGSTSDLRVRVGVGLN